MRYGLKLALPAAVVTALTASPLYAQNAKSFAASTGNDSNTCATEAAPCRTLHGAVGKTNANGVVYCLDNGEFSNGPAISINKSITIDCAGTGASFKATGIAILIGGAATDVIHIRGLKIFSLNNPSVSLPSTNFAGSLRIEDCDLVEGSAVHPVVALGANPGTNVVEVLIARTTISGGSSGILVQPDGGGAKVVLDDVRVFNNGIGIDLQGTNATVAPNLRVAIKNSTVVGNTNQGIRAVSTNGLTRGFLKDTLVAQNGTGLQSSGTGAGIHVSHSTISHNGTNLSALSGGILVSFGNNEVVAPFTGNGAFTHTTTLK